MPEINLVNRGQKTDGRGFQLIEKNEGKYV